MSTKHIQSEIASFFLKITDKSYVSRNLPYIGLIVDLIKHGGEVDTRSTEKAAMGAIQREVSDTHHTHGIAGIPDLLPLCIHVYLWREGEMMRN